MIRTSAIVIGLSIAATAAADPACVEPGAEPVMLAMAKGKASFCFRVTDAQATCFTLDVASNKVAPAPAPKPLGQIWPIHAPPATPSPIAITHADSGAKPRLCHRDGSHCVTLAMSHPIDQGMGLVEAENASLTLAALASLQFIDTFDLKTGKRLASFESGPKHSSCPGLEFANDTLVVSEQADCAGASYAAWLATSTGTKLADVGGDTPISIGAQSMAKLAGDRYAFATVGGDFVIEQDVKTGKVGKRITVGAATSGGPAYLLGDGGTLVVLYGGTRAGELGLIDVATDKVTRVAAPRCSK